jgi:hypothetical protein
MLLDAGFLRHDGNVVTKAIFNKLLKPSGACLPTPE